MERESLTALAIIGAVFCGMLLYRIAASLDRIEDLLRGKPSADDEDEELEERL